MDTLDGVQAELEAHRLSPEQQTNLGPRVTAKTIFSTAEVGWRITRVAIGNVDRYHSVEQIKDRLLLNAHGTKCSKDRVTRSEHVLVRE